MVDAQMLEELLGVTEVVSADYNSVKALVNGELNTFLGFNFIRTELTPWVNTFLGFNFIRTELTPWVNESSDYRGSLAIQGSGLGMAIGQDVITRIDERADKSYSTQVYLCMTFGATRVEEEKVVEIACDMSP
jgi:hypothetical protein